MKLQFYFIFSVTLFLGYNDISAKLNEFGISDIIPSRANNNDIFDQRISEEITNNNLTFQGRHTESFTIQDIVDFIAKIDAYFQNYLDHADNQNPKDLELIKLAIIDVEKAKKMLKPQNVTPYEEHLLRDAFNPIKTKINAYDHTDNIEESSYVRS